MALGKHGRDILSNIGRIAGPSFLGRGRTVSGPFINADYDPLLVLPSSLCGSRQTGLRFGETWSILSALGYTDNVEAEVMH